MAVVDSPFAGTYATTQVFGVNPASYARFGLAGHDGIDWALPDSTPVYSPETGTLSVGHDPSGYGEYVKITTDQGAMWLLGHLGRIDIADGSPVAAGQQVGLSDNTGNSTGPHLHGSYFPPGWENNRLNGFGGAQDPAPILAGSAFPNIASPVTGLPDTSNTLPYDPNNPPDYSFQPPDVTHSPLVLAGGALLLLVVAASVADN